MPDMPYETKLQDGWAEKVAALDTYPDAAGDGSFDATLREAVTDLDLIAIEHAALSWGQLTEQDS